MISNIVKNIFWVLYTLFIDMGFVASIIAAAVWLATALSNTRAITTMHLKDLKSKSERLSG